MTFVERLGVAAATAFVVAFVGCGDHGLCLPGVTVNLDISEQTIPGFAPSSVQGSCAVNATGSGALSTDSFQPVSLSIKDSQELRGRSILRFTRVEVDEVRLTIIPPSQSGQTWDFLDSIELFADVPGDNQPPVLVAKLDPVPRGQTTIVINGTGADISDIASHDTFEVTGQVSGRPPCADVHFDGKAKFDVGL